MLLLLLLVLHLHLHLVLVLRLRRLKLLQQQRAITPRRPKIIQQRHPRLAALDLPPTRLRINNRPVHLERRGQGYRVSYAIADVGAVVALGGALDAEARRAAAAAADALLVFFAT